MKHLSFNQSDQVALIGLKADDAKANILHQEFLDELNQLAKELQGMPGIEGAILFSQKEEGFVAGTDLKRIALLEDPAEAKALSQQGQKVLEQWASLPFPVVAALHGACTGGGAELALACDGRVASKDSFIALPEVTLGFLPRWGGTQRLPRLVALETALEMILTGRMVRANDALDKGLIDEICDKDDLMTAAHALIKRISTSPQSVHQSRQAKQGPPLLRRLKHAPFVRRFLFRRAHQKYLVKTGGHYPAPVRALMTLRDTAGKSMAEGLTMEAEQFGYLVTTSACKNMIHAFALSKLGQKRTEALKRISPINRAAVLGAGVMGAGIAQWLAEKGVCVQLKDKDTPTAERGMEAIRDLATTRLKRQQRLDDLSTLLDLVEVNHNTAGLPEVEIVIESVVESLETKQAVIKEVERAIAPNTVIASNTSALSITRLQADCLRPENVAGLHFFNPVDRMSLVEVIRGEKTSDQTVSSLFQLAHQLEKVPIEVRDRPGFLVNRLLGTYLIEACLLVEEGVRWQSLEKLAIEFGWPMGPFRLIDAIGLDIVVEISKTLTSELPYLRPATLLDRAVEMGLLGQKGGIGFYLPHQKDERKDEEIEHLLHLPQKREATPADLDRMLYLMVNEAGRCMDETVVTGPEALDTGTLFGLGFPRFRGGLARYADDETLDHILQQLRKLEPQGERFQPSDTLRSLDRFYPRKR